MFPIELVPQIVLLLQCEESISRMHMVRLKSNCFNYSDGNYSLRDKTLKSKSSLLFKKTNYLFFFCDQQHLVLEMHVEVE